MIKLLVADDHEVVRSGLASLIANTDIQLVAQAGSGEEARKKAMSAEPDVILLDIRMNEGDGLTTLEWLKQKLPKTPVLMLSTYDNPTYVARAMALGASGYILKGSSRNEILSAIRTVAGGKTAWTQEELGRLTGGMKTQAVGEADLETPLTQRESQVLRQLALGLSNKEIARTLHISVETVKEHVHHVLTKLGVSGRTQAAVWAVRKGLI
jgi:DNA-binding NarL/FixJ family response regulator